MTSETRLLRQIHPKFVKQGRVTSQAFKPMPKDEGKLSVYDGDMITSADSWKHYRERKLESVGVRAVTVAECNNEQLQVRSSPEDFLEHAEIDFTDLSRNECESKSKRLRNAAEARGWLFQADSVS